MKAIIVCVNYSDFLSITLPRNLHHFTEVMVVTSFQDPETIELVRELRLKVATTKLTLYITEAFYDDGADFNKWKALEEGLDHLGREGLICILDADIVWPDRLPDSFRPEIGKLYSPLRRMLTEVTTELPTEPEWKEYPIHRNIGEFAGYSQIFYGEDPVLGPAPWHEINWKHAGGADSFFQRKWKKENKIRPDFEVLHLGVAGLNWFGRATPYLDGTVEDEAEERKRKYFEVWRERRRLKSIEQEKIQ